MRLRHRFYSKACLLTAFSMLLVVTAARGAPQADGIASSDASKWGITGSAPQTGSSDHTSGKAFASPLQVRELSASKIRVMIDKRSQKMKVYVDDAERYSWKISSGLPGYATPSGSFVARSMNEIWYSREWDNAPMPHAIFFTSSGHAIHGTNEIRKLGKPASHGCVRVAPEHAAALFELVEENGLENTEIVLTGVTPGGETKVMSKKPRNPRAKLATRTIRAKTGSDEVFGVSARGQSPRGANARHHTPSGFYQKY